jgi:hypothetical protein
MDVQAQDGAERASDTAARKGGLSENNRPFRIIPEAVMDLIALIDTVRRQRQWHRFEVVM